MKRTFERIAFMIIGACIACFAYMLGSIDSDVQAQKQDILTCDTLVVRNNIIVGDTEKGAIVLMSNANNDQQTISIGRPEKGAIILRSDANIEEQVINIGHPNKGEIGIYVRGEQQAIFIHDKINLKNDRPDESILIVNDNGWGSISLKDKFGRHVIHTQK